MVVHRFPFLYSPNSVCDIYLNREKVPLFLNVLSVHGTIDVSIRRSGI